VVYKIYNASLVHYRAVSLFTLLSFQRVRTANILVVMEIEGIIKYISEDQQYLQFVSRCTCWMREDLRLPYDQNQYHAQVEK